MESLERAHAVVEVEATVQGEAMRVVGEAWMDGEQARAQVLEASRPEVVGALAVSDGTTGWLYHPAADRVLTGEVAALKAYREANAGEAPDFDLNSLTEMVDELLRLSDQELVGSETIAGLDAWHLRLTPNEEAPPAWVAAGGVVELWVSKDHDLPLQLILAGGSMGEGRVTVRQIEPDAPVAAELFAFAPPAGVEVVDVVTLLPEPMTLVEARAAAGSPLLSTPADSAEAALVEVYRLQETIWQKFDGTLGEWSLAQGAALPEHGSERAAQAARPVRVRGVTGQLWSDPERGRTVLAWQENGLFVLLSGSLSPESALRVAERLE